MNRTERNSADRRAGVSLLEMAFAVTLLTVGVLGFMNAAYSTQSGLSTVQEIDLVELAFENVSERLQSTAFEDVFTTFSNTVHEIEGLESPDGGAAQVHVTCFVSEAAIPTAFGPVADLDGNPSAISNDCSTTYRVLPVRLQVRYATTKGPRTSDLFLVLDGE